MPTKFKFDFDENAEPVTELHRYRAALSKRYKTTEELLDYYDTVSKESGVIIENGRIVGWKEHATGIPDTTNRPAAKSKKHTAALKSKPAKKVAAH